MVITFSGCPGGSVRDTTPNWITTAWPPVYQEALAWQWEQRLIPYWKGATAFAADAAVKVAWKRIRASVSTTPRHSCGCEITAATRWVSILIPVTCGGRE